MGGERVETGSSSRNNPLTQKDLARARAELKAPPWTRRTRRRRIGVNLCKYY